MLESSVLSPAGSKGEAKACSAQGQCRTEEGGSTQAGPAGNTDQHTIVQVH